MARLLLPRELDEYLNYPRGRSLRLAKAGAMPCVVLPDQEIRFDLREVEAALSRDHANGIGGQLFPLCEASQILMVGEARLRAEVDRGVIPYWFVQAKGGQRRAYFDLETTGRALGKVLNQPKRLPEENTDA